MTTEWQRVAREVRTRRLALNLTQSQAAQAGGVSEPVWNAIENTRQDSYAGLTPSGICRALTWTPDSINLILAGQDPKPVGDAMKDWLEMTPAEIALELAKGAEELRRKLDGPPPRSRRRGA